MRFLILSLTVSSVALLSCQTSSKTKYAGHGAGSISEETIQKYAPKPLPPEERRQIESMLDIRTPSLGVLSPDGKSMYVSWSVTGTNQVWKVPGPMRFPVQLTGGEDKASVATITPDGRSLILSRDRSGDEYPGIYLQSVEGGPLKTIYRKDKVQAFAEFVTDDSRYLYFRANDVKPDTYNIYRYDLKEDRLEKIYEPEQGYWVIADRKKDGTLLLGKWTGNTSSEFYILKKGAKTPEPVLGQGDEDEYSASFSAHPGELVVLTNKFGEFRRLYRYKLSNKKFDAVTPEWKYDIAGIQMDDPKQKILLSTNEDGYYRIRALDARTFKNLRVPEFKDKNVLHVYFGATTRDGRYTTLGVEKSNAPRTNYVYDWRRGQLEQWVRSSSPEIDTSDAVVPALESYPARDGTQIPMFVYRPHQCVKKTCPVIVQFHGGPESQANPRFSPTLQLYMDEGFVWVEPNVRGSDGYGKSWLHADNGPKRLDVITDIEDAALFIKKNWAYDGQVPKVGVTGGSYGGYSTLYAMTRFAGAYDAGVAVVGMSSLLTFLENTAPYRRQLRVTEYGDPVKDREALTELSPMTHLAKIQDPLMIIHGVTDPRVPAGEAVQIYEAIKRKGVDGELVLFADEGHGVSKRANRVSAQGLTLQFFKKHLK